MIREPWRSKEPLSTFIVRPMGSYERTVADREASSSYASLHRIGITTTRLSRRDLQFATESEQEEHRGHQRGRQHQQLKQMIR
jgi:hypothetical protein